MYTSKALVALVLLGALAASSHGQRNVPQPSKPSSIQDIPGIVSLHTDNKTVCVGSILDELHVLTTGRCGKELFGPKSSVRSGSSLVSSGGQTHEVHNITVHPSYSRKNLDYDVAVLTVDAATPLNKSSRVLFAKKTEQLQSSQPLLVYGWGSIREFDLPENHTFSVEVLPFLDRGDCNRFLTGSFSPAKLVTDRMLCTRIDPRYPTISNYGSPVLTESKVQVAISSWHRNRPDDVVIMHTDLTNPDIQEFISQALKV